MTVVVVLISVSESILTVIQWTYGSNIWFGWQATLTDSVPRGSELNYTVTAIRKRQSISDMIHLILKGCGMVYMLPKWNMLFNCVLFSMLFMVTRIICMFEGVIHWVAAHPSQISLFRPKVDTWQVHRTLHSDGSADALSPYPLLFLHLSRARVEL